MFGPTELEGLVVVVGVELLELVVDEDELVGTLVAGVRGVAGTVVVPCWNSSGTSTSPS